MKLYFCAIVLPILVLAPALVSARDIGSDEFIKSRFPLPEAAVNVSRFEAGDAIGPGEKIAPSALDCPGGVIAAATPGQFTKKYHVDALVYYDLNKIPGTREVAPAADTAKLPGNYIGSVNLCRISAKSENLNPATGDRWCMLAKVGRYTMMSDFFACRVGGEVHVYRGYWESAAIYQGFNKADPMQTFRSENEHVMTMSMGRGDSMVANPQFPTAYDSVPGDTFAEEKTRFLFFTGATEADLQKIDEVVAAQTGPKGNYLACAEGVFKAKGKGDCSK